MSKAVVLLVLSVVAMTLASSVRWPEEGGEAQIMDGGELYKKIEKRGAPARMVDIEGKKVEKRDTILTTSPYYPYWYSRYGYPMLPEYPYYEPAARGLGYPYRHLYYV